MAEHYRGVCGLTRRCSNQTAPARRTKALGVVDGPAALGTVVTRPTPALAKTPAPRPRRPPKGGGAELFSVDATFSERTVTGLAQPGAAS